MKNIIKYVILCYIKLKLRRLTILERLLVRSENPYVVGSIPTCGKGDFLMESPFFAFLLEKIAKKAKKN